VPFGSTTSRPECRYNEPRSDEPWYSPKLLITHRSASIESYFASSHCGLCCGQGSLPPGGATRYTGKLGPLGVSGGSAAPVGMVDSLHADTTSAKASILNGHCDAVLLRFDFTISAVGQAAVYGHVPHISWEDPRGNEARTSTSRSDDGPGATDIRVMCADNRPLSTDIGLVPEDIRLLSAAAGRLSRTRARVPRTNA
jgi:hypothetical protein